MRVIRLPNGNLVVPVESDDPEDKKFAELSPDDDGYEKWLPYAVDGPDPRAAKARDGP